MDSPEVLGNAIAPGFFSNPRIMFLLTKTSPVVKKYHKTTSMIEPRKKAVINVNGKVIKRFLTDMPRIVSAPKMASINS